METPTPARGSDHRSVTSQAIGALVVTAFVVLGLWRGAVPPLPPVPTFLVATGTGVCLGVALAVFDVDPFDTVLVGFLASALLVAGALYVGGVLFPEDLPTSVELCLLAWAWSDVLARVALRNRTSE